MKTIKNVTDVVKWRLCLGCGACAYICPEANIRLLDFLDEGIRPVRTHDSCGGCRQCLEICPAMQTDFRRPRLSVDEVLDAQGWGPITALWEGYASDADIRYKGASGGVLTAIGAYCVERLGMHGVLHIVQNEIDPVRNRTRLSRTREELVAATGSRYSPASVCNGLGLVERSPSPCVIIGKPSEIAAVENARRMRPELDAKVGVTLSFFCAESPSTGGTLALLEKLGVPVDALRDLRFRGRGWPGHFAPVLQGESEPLVKVPYRESWAFLQAFRPWSVQLWPDAIGELADITCGDPWYEEPDGANPGFSLVLARTPRGRDIVEGAIAAGYLDLKTAEPWKLEKSQAGLLSKKGSVWGRLLAMRLLGMPTPRFNGGRLFKSWHRLPLTDKFKSFFGTIRRILTRRLYRPLCLARSNRVEIKRP